MKKIRTTTLNRTHGKRGEQPGGRRGEVNIRAFNFNLVEIRAIFQLITTLRLSENGSHTDCRPSPLDAGAALQRVSLRLCDPSKHSTISAGDSAPDWRFCLALFNPSPVDHDRIRRHEYLVISAVKKKVWGLGQKSNNATLPRTFFYGGSCLVG
jgi:hypothetical protein